MPRGPRSEGDGRPIPYRKAPQDGGIKPVFLDQDPGSQRVLGIAGKDRHAGLAKDRACIQFCRHFMHCAASLGIARGKRAGVRM